MRKVMIGCKTKNLDEFRRLAEFSKEVGATHVGISQVETSMWQWDRDRRDPYPNWAMFQATIFKVVIPDELKGFLPADEAKRNFEMIAKRAEILKEYGLKAKFNGMEPAWFPEEAYLANPDWRGPRCDQPRRTTSEYYAPCTDNPEVRKMYFDAVKQLCSVAPIEYFSFLTNDSGGGLCWEDRLYPGKNGPLSCSHISLTDRTVNFLSLIQDAAAEVGVKAEVGFARSFMDYEIAAIVPNLKEGQFIGNHYNSNSVTTHSVGSSFHKDPLHPVIGVPEIVMVADQMMKFADDDVNNINYGMPVLRQKAYMQFIKDNAGKMEKSTLGKYNALKRTAVALIGEKYANRLVDIWDNIDKARDRMHFWNVGGHVSMLGTVHQRWLTRPLVAFQSELTDEEKAYYRPYLFQATGERDAENMVNMQGTIWLGGVSAQINFEKCADYAISALKSAISIIDELVAKDDIGDYKTELDELKLRIEMCICVITNQKNVITFQSIIDRTDYDAVVEDKSIVNDEQGDRRLYKIQRVVRNEIDNTYEMIRILDKANGPVLAVSDSLETKSVMELGPDVKDDLLKKIEIMNKYRMDFNRLYKCFNI